MIFRNLVVSVVVLVFGAIYEYFSFGVYSVFMIYAFAIFLILGVFLFAVVLHFKQQLKLRRDGIFLYHFGLSTFTVGCIVQGILEIYGTTNSRVRFYWIIGVVMVLMGAVTACFPAKE